MADPGSYNKTHVGNSQVMSPIKRKSHSRFLCKALIILFILIVIPMFPSKAPEFINQPILIKFWELFYLSFIGIAVCYGVFSRRNVETESQNRNPNVDSPDVYFGHLFECDDDDKKVVQSWDSKYFRADPDWGIKSMRLGSAFRNPMPSVSDSLCTTPHKSINGSVSISGLDGSENGKFVGELSSENVLPLPVHWNLRSESERVEMGEEVGIFVSPHSEFMLLPLEEFKSNVPESRSVGFIGSSTSRIGLRQQVCSVPPLDSKLFQEGTQFEWLEESNSFYSHKSSNSTANSAEEHEFESVESRSITSTSSFPLLNCLGSSPSKISPYSSVSSELSSSKIEELERDQNSPSSSMTLELENSKVEELDEKKSSPSSSTTLELPNSIREELKEKKSSKNRKTKLISKSCHHGYVSSSEMNLSISSFKDGSVSDGSSTSRKEDLLGNEEQKLASVKSDMKNGTNVKASSLRGKSVRTIRPREDVVETRISGDECRDRSDSVFKKKFKEDEVRKQIVDNPVVESAKAEENFRDQRDNMNRKRIGKFGEGLMGKVGKKSVGADNLSVVCRDRKEDTVRKRDTKAEIRKVGRRSRRPDHPSVRGKKHNFDNAIAKPEPIEPMYQDGSEQGFFGSEEDSNSKDDSIRESSNGQEDDVEIDKNEIDKKAGEFIAKFKEQMRFEKVSANVVDKKAGEFIAKFKEQIRLEKISKRSR